MTHANNLLAMSEPLMITVIVAGSLGALAFIYGIFRKFSRMSWVGYQLAILFAATLLIEFLPAMEAPWYFVTVACGFFALEAIVLGSGAIIRHAIRSRRYRAHAFWRAMDRVLGALTAAINVAALLFVFGTFAAAIMLNVLPSPPEFVASLGELGIWQEYGQYAPDFLLIAFLTFAVKAGYKLGFARLLWLALALVLTAGALFGSMILVIEVPFLTSFASLIADTMPQDNLLVAIVVGHMVASLVVFLVLFFVIVLLTLLVNLIMKRVFRSTVFNVIDGIILAVIFFAAALAIVVGTYFGLDFLLGQLHTQELGLNVEEYLENLLGMFGRAPFGSVFYWFNPFFG